MSDVKRYNSGEVADDYLDAHEIVGDCELLWVRASDYDALEQRFDRLNQWLGEECEKRKKAEVAEKELRAELNLLNTQRNLAIGRAEKAEASLREQEGLLQWAQTATDVHISTNPPSKECSATTYEGYGEELEEVVGEGDSILAALRAIRERVEPQGEKWGDNWSGVI